MSGVREVRRVEKPWGHEIIWAANELYVGKILHVRAGHRLSTQFHRIKDETIYVLSGELRYFAQAETEGPLVETVMHAGDAFRVSPGTIHYMQAITDCDVLEASTPHLDDLVRVEDAYGREGTSAP